MADPTYDDLTTTTLRMRATDIKDNVTNNNAFLSRLKEKGKWRSTPGGSEILETLTYGTSPNTMWYNGADPFSLGTAKFISASKWDWKQMGDAVVITGREKRINSGPQQKIDLVGERVDNIQASMMNAMDVALFGDGTASGGKVIVGLAAALSSTQTSGTYGGIDRSAFSFWQAQVKTTTTTSSNIRPTMADPIVKRRRGNDRIDLVLAGDTKFLELNEALAGLQMYTNSKLAEAGFETLRFMGADVVAAGGIGGNITTTTCYFLNTNYWWLRYHPDANFAVLGDGDREPVNQDATVKLFGWMGALTCSGLQFQAVGIFA